MFNFFRAVVIIGLVFVVVPLFIVVATAQIPLTLKIMLMGLFILIVGWLGMLCTI